MMTEAARGIVAVEGLPFRAGTIWYPDVKEKTHG